MRVKDVAGGQPAASLESTLGTANMAAGGSKERHTVVAAVVTVVGVVVAGALLVVLSGVRPPLGSQNIEVVVGLVAFGLLFYFMTRLIFPRLEEIYALRADRIDGGLARAEETRAQALDLKRQYDRQIGEARAEGARIRDTARAEGAAIKAEMRAAAETEVAGMLARGQEEISRQRTSAARALRPELGALSVQVAEQVLGTVLPDGASTDVDRYLADLDRQNAPTN